MKKNLLISLLATSTLTLAAAEVVTPEVAAYRTRMEHAQDLQESIRDGIRAKDAKTVSTLSRELTDLLQDDERYWEKKQIPDAVNLGRQSVRFAQQMTTDAGAQRLPEALDNLRQLQKTCLACHDAHPEKRVK